MKQRKKPFLLMTIVVTLVVVLLGVNMSQYLRDPNRIQEREAPNAETVAKMRARQASAAVPDGVEIADMMDASSMQTAGAGSMNPVGEVPTNPSIELPRLQKYKAPYQTDSTSALWYEEHSKQREMSEERVGGFKGSQE